VIIDGRTVPARWDDGDTFSSPAPGGGKPSRNRLRGYNTLESYGPVHRWGDWTGAELYALAKQAGVRAASERWKCTRIPGGGGYGRDLIDCPDLRQALVREGLAHLFFIEGTPGPADLEAQREAIAEHRGMWKKGAPKGVVTSLHSLNEKPQKSTYNRVADTTTGVASKSTHSETYRACEEVCVAGSCMIYVPYKLRYGDDRAACLR